MKFIETLDQLSALYADPVPASLSKVATRLTPKYREWIMASRYCVLSTVGSGGTDGSPRGEDGPVVAELDDKTLLLPDWAGNNRTDSLINIVEDGRLSLMFMIAGVKPVVRINGRGRLTADPDICAQFDKNGKKPKTVIVIEISEIYFQCAKATMRSEIWQDIEPPKDIPTGGDFLKELTKGAAGGAEYDASYEAHAQNILWSKDD